MTAKEIAGAFTVEREVRVRAPRERVFELLSSREQMSRWMPVAAFEPRVGGRVEWLFDTESGEIITFGEVTAYDPPARLAFTWDYVQWPIGARTEVVLDLEERGDETVVRLTHVGFVDEKQKNSHNEGWTYHLNRLAAIANGEDPGPDRHELAVHRATALANLSREEIALRNHIEDVAVMRRRLPLPVPVRTEYTFRADENTTLGLAEMFGDHDELLMYHYMFAPEDELPCPMCTMWIDGYNAIAPYVRKRAAFVVVAKAPIARLRDWAESRRWTGIPIYSSYETTFNRDFRGEDSDGDQQPSISVFKRTPEGVHHVYQKFATLDEEHNRGIDLLSPVWNLFDLLPSGRAEYMPNYELA
jgi:predicted dithiol-disulfide oxidoreductase (DUF899 family)/uncharacterized protein YndB with AHSA1/START domain